jgi:apolipoprotein N-acyltransferase
MNVSEASVRGMGRYENRSPPSRQSTSLLAIVVGTAISASCYYISTGLGEFWPAAWIAPIPVLLLAFRCSGRTAIVIALSAYFLGSLNVFSYSARLMPVALVVALLLIPAVVFAFTVAATRYVVDRLSPWLAAFAFAAAWTSFEFLVSLASAHGTALNLAYSQTDLLPLLQIASVTGIWGMTFVLTLVPSAVAVAWSRRAPSALIPAAAMGLIVFGYGTYRLSRPPLGPDVRVGLAACDQSIGSAFDTENASEALVVARAYAERIVRLAAQGAQVVVLPEKLVGVTPDDASGVLKVFSDTARDARVTVVVGLNRVAITPRRNVAVVFGSDGQMLTEYEKHHLLPGPETGYATGMKTGLFTVHGVRWGVAICKDMDFPAWSRQYGQQGVRILAVPAWDFVLDARLHSRMAVVRGVENGFTLVRVAAQGLLTCSDANGRILAQESSATVPDALLIRHIGPGPGSTLYTRYGDWLGWVSVALFVGLLVGASALKQGRIAVVR